MLEDAATADVLNRGRLEFGVGRGAAPIYFSGYNVPQEESRERFEECLDVILKGWASDKLTYQGKYFQVQDLILTPKPVQKPYPPIRIAANSPDTFALAGKQGMAIFASPLINPPAKLREYLAVHRDTLPSGVKQDIALAFPVHVSDSRVQARRECEESLMHFFTMAREVIKPLAGATIKSYEAYKQLQDRIERVSYEGVEKIGGIFGDPAYCIERVKALQEEFQTTEFICYFNQGGLVAPATVKRSMELFATKVMPACR